MEPAEFLAAAKEQLPGATPSQRVELWEELGEAAQAPGNSPAQRALATAMRPCMLPPPLGAHAQGQQLQGGGRLGAPERGAARRCLPARAAAAAPQRRDTRSLSLAPPRAGFVEENAQELVSLAVKELPRAADAGAGREGRLPRTPMAALQRQRLRVRTPAACAHACSSSSSRLRRLVHPLLSNACVLTRCARARSPAAELASAVQGALARGVEVSETFLKTLAGAVVKQEKAKLAPHVSRQREGRSGERRGAAGAMQGGVAWGDDASVREGV